ncbi:MAG: asparagine--tRNA ligase [candidate division Zixibacteria bacterium CG_4_9_14_3_um_filter_46_8]|nr:MAG: asparagine--tRNA ligase [candidate division Zixibacteria bacterium CG_4_9_14_3_um_filter_46_8]
MNWVYVKYFKDHDGEEITVRGWVYNKRESGKIRFLIVRDGTGLVQCVLVKSELTLEEWEKFSQLTQESSLEVTGMLRAEVRAPGGFELIVKSINIIQIAIDYPITLKEHNVDFLLDRRHLWLRSSRQHSIMLIRNELIKATRDYFYDNDFVLIDTPLITGSIGETASTLFKTEYYDFGTAYLAQTGQLYLEAACMAHGKVYCFGPSFRAEKSKTRRHLSEYWHVEAEVAFYDNNDNMRLQENYVSHIVSRVSQKCRPQLEALERDISLLEKVTTPFHRLSYDDAVIKLQQVGSDIKWGDDLGADDETILTQQYEKPIFIMNYPSKAKAFYMKRNPDNPETVLCSDMLAPEGYGEIVGASQREDDYDLLLHRIREEKLPEESYGWFLDLRKYGSVPHSGFGLGIERTVTWICGLKHVRESIPFPRMLYRLYP